MKVMAAIFKIPKKTWSYCTEILWDSPDSKEEPKRVYRRESAWLRLLSVRSTTPAGRNSPGNEAWEDKALFHCHSFVGSIGLFVVI